MRKAPLLAQEKLSKFPCKDSPEGAASVCQALERPSEAEKRDTEYKAFQVFLRAAILS